MQKIVIHNHKGGVCKTTTTQVLSFIACMKGKSVLMIDLDGQGNLSEIYRVPNPDDFTGIVSAFGQMMNGEFTTGSAMESLHECVNPVESSGITYPSILAGASKLYDVARQIEMFEGQRHQLLSWILQEYDPYFDLCFIDTPAGSNWLVTNALFAADSLLVPVECEKLAVVGLASFSSALSDFKRLYNLTIKPDWIVPVKVNKSRSAHIQYLAELKSAFPAQTTDTYIGVDANFERSQTNNIPISVLSPKSRGNLEYIELGKELGLWA